MIVSKTTLWLILALLLVSPTAHADSAKDSLQTGKVALQSIGALEMGPDGILFVADPQGAAVWALDVAPPEKREGEPMGMLEDLDGKLAALLGTSPRDVYVRDMIVHEASGTVYLSLTRGEGDAAIPLLFQVASDGAISEISLASIAHQKLDIANAPGPDAKYGRSRLARPYTVTDLEFIDGELFIAGLSNEEFASTLRRTSFPFGGEMGVTGLEIYHGAHAALETHAPIFSFVSYELAGKPHILAGYLCTPLVTFPLDQIRAQAKLRGKTIAELGWGNIPTDILVYEYEGEDFFLVVNSRRGAMKLNASDIAEAQAGEGITSGEHEPRTGVVDHSVPIGHAVQVANLDAGHILILGRSMDNGSLYLESREKKWL